MRLSGVLASVLLVIFCSGDVALSVTNSTEARDAGDSELPKLEAGLDVSKMAVLTQRLESGGHPNLHMVLVEHRGELGVGGRSIDIDKTRGYGLE